MDRHYEYILLTQNENYLNEEDIGNENKPNIKLFLNRVSVVLFLTI